MTHFPTQNIAMSTKEEIYYWFISRGFSSCFFYCWVWCLSISLSFFLISFLSLPLPLFLFLPFLPSFLVIRSLCLCVWMCDGWLFFWCKMLLGCSFILSFHFWEVCVGRVCYLLLYLHVIRMICWLLNNGLYVKNNSLSLTVGGIGMSKSFLITLWRTNDKRVHLNFCLNVYGWFYEYTYTLHTKSFFSSSSFFVCAILVLRCLQWSMFIRTICTGFT